MSYRNFYNLPILLLLIAAVYSNTLHSPFIYDDEPAILDNRPIHIERLSSDALTKILHESHANTRIIANISFALNYLWNGLEPFGYHLVNIAIHMLCTIGIYLLLYEILLRSSRKSYKKYAASLAFAIAAIWGLHPIQTQAVNYIVQRMTILSSMFYIFSFYCYLKARASRIKWEKTILFCICLILWLLAMGSKEIAITLPLVIFLYESIFAIQESIKKRKRLIITGITLLIIPVLFMFFYTLTYKGLSNPLTLIIHEINKTQNFPGGEIPHLNRLMTEARVVVYYISLLLLPLPSRQMLIYTYPPSNTLFDPVTTILSIITISAFLFMAYRLMKKRPFISFFILWYFINLILESTIINLHLAFEHRLYLPSIGIAAITVLLIHELSLLHIERKRLTHILFALTTILLATATFTRNTTWKDSVTLYEDNLKKNNKSPALYTNLGLNYIKEERLDEAIAHFNNAIRLDPFHAKAYKNKGVAYHRKNMMNLAILNHEKAIKLSPADPESYSNLGVVLNDIGMFTEAVQQFNKAISIDPENHEFYLKKGISFHRKGLWDEAIKQFDITLKLYPKSFEARYNKGGIYNNKGNWDKAIEEFNIATKLSSSENSDIYYQMGIAYLNKGMYDTAIEQFNAAAGLSPEDFKIHINTGIAYSNMENWDKAKEAFDTAAEISPEIYHPHYYKGISLIKEKKYKEAEKALEIAKRLKNSDPYIMSHLAIAYSKTGKLNRAINELETAVQMNEKIALDGEYSSAYILLGDLYVKTKKIKSAESAYQAALSQDHANLDLLYKLGTINAIALGNTARAEKYFRLFLDKSSETKESKRRKIANGFLAKSSN